MSTFRNTAFLLLIAAIPLAAAPLLTPSAPDICFAHGPVTYRLSTGASVPDYRVAIDNSAARPDLRVRLVDRVETADFALTDDAGTTAGNACRTAGPMRTVRVVPLGEAPDLVIALSPQDNGQADFSLYVHSARVSHGDAAALFALVRHAPDTDRKRDGGQVAQAR